MAKHQLIVIHGGDVFDTYEEYLDFLRAYRVDAGIFALNNWKNNLGSLLGADFEVLLPMMPNKFNAKYLEWKIWFEKLIPFFAPEVGLIGHSLGGMFLVKYLAENTLPLTVRGLFLVSTCFGPTEEYSVADFALPVSLKGVSEQCSHIFIYHSSDDPVVPYSDAALFERALPGSVVRRLEGRGHCNQPDLPELTADIEALYAA